MSKYSYETKKKIVMEYLNGEGGGKYLAKKHGIKDKKSIMNWVKSYQAFGDDGIKPSKGNKQYTLQFKENVVQLYLTTEMSYQEVALKAGLNHPSLVARWVKKYKELGSDAFRVNIKEHELNMIKLNNEELEPVTEVTDDVKSNSNNKKTKSKKKNTSKEQTPEELKEYVAKLEKNLLHLEIENAFLKELRRLNSDPKNPNK